MGTHQGPTPTNVPIPTEKKSLNKYIAKPDDFDGKDYRRFELQIRIYLTANHEVIKEDQEKILFVLSHMKGGTTGPWAENWFNAQNDANKWDTFTQFKAKLEAAFDDPNRVRNAQNHLMNTFQKPQETVEEFLQKFEINR
jgi:hypothetical protein